MSNRISPSINERWADFRHKLNAIDEYRMNLKTKSYKDLESMTYAKEILTIREYKIFKKSVKDTQG